MPEDINKELWFKASARSKPVIEDISLYGITIVDIDETFINSRGGGGYWGVKVTFANQEDITFYKLCGKYGNTLSVILMVGEAG